MVPKVKRYRIIYLILFLGVLTACDFLPIDFFPRPPTLIPGVGTTASSTPEVDLVTPTAPGFPTQPFLETQEQTENPVATTPAIEQTATPPTPGAGSPAFPSATPRPDPFFVLQPGNPLPMVNFLKPELGCNWMGIGGQIFNLQGEPLVNYLVQVEGELGSQQVSVLGLTGGAPQLGQGGFLLEIAAQPIESSGMLYLKVLDLEGRILSDKVFITTYPDCERNLILINFSQLPAGMDNTIYLPSISND